MTFTIAQIAEKVRGEVLGDGTVTVGKIAAADEARAGDLTFAEKEDFFKCAEEGEASAILAPAPFVSARKPVIRVANARIAVAVLLPLFYPEEAQEAGIDPLARVAASAEVDPTAYVGPGCVIGERAKIGARSVLMGGNHVGRDARIGAETRLFPNVVIYHRCEIGNRVTIHAGTVIGSDGYGYVFDAGRHRKVLQVGNVVVKDDVEIGANAAIDRAALGSTVIGQGTKIDNLVHVAHNVVMGNHCLVMGQVGFAGSTHLADYVVIASQSGIAGHLKLGKQATVGAKSGVMRDVPDGGTVLGIPAMPDKQTKRQWIALQQLPDVIKRVRALEAGAGEASKSPVDS
ncbi:MAG TPA: UDP-3-O-(3-hydroxymyristoyl)glucosamine N-acyltransferase [Verrucomicrobiae bacterium]|nr:UDP-3-O-(3-hydroxymyristoyl)glucosamine N-acyltransferase [Verrucomicrobiae bacterium]